MPCGGERGQHSHPIPPLHTHLQLPRKPLQGGGDTGRGEPTVHPSGPALHMQGRPCRDRAVFSVGGEEKEEGERGEGRRMQGEERRMQEAGRRERVEGSRREEEGGGGNRGASREEGERKKEERGGREEEGGRGRKEKRWREEGGGEAGRRGRGRRERREAEQGNIPLWLELDAFLRHPPLCWPKPRWAGAWLIADGEGRHE